MRIGDLDKIIDIQAPTKVTDGMGGFTTTWTTIYSGIYAAIWPVSARDRIKSDQIIGEVTDNVRIWFKRVLKPGWRVKYGNSYYAIVGPPINKNKGNRMLDLLCKEVVV